MGESTIWSVSADAEAKQIVARWQRDFSTMVGGNRSRLLCIAIKTLDRLGFTAERLVEALNAPQRIRLENEQQALANLNNLSQVSAVPYEQKKPPVRVHGVPSGRGRSIHGVNRRSLLDGLEVRWACLLPPFSGKVRPFKSNSFRRVA